MAHSDSVTGICFESAAHQLFTSGHDGNIRVWDIRTYKCLNDLKVGFSQQANRKKYDEAIYNIDTVRGQLMITAGADAVIKLLSINNK